MNRAELATLIVNRLESDAGALSAAWRASGPIGHCIVDELLPLDTANALYAAFPDPRAMVLKNSLRERKFVAAQMNRFAPLLEEAVFAFHDERVLAVVARITGLQAMDADRQLYAGGISLMGKGHFLNPHIDNSHDKDRRRYRVLNLLYYCSPQWNAANGGHLELWPGGVEGTPITIESRFNRLVLMATHGRSWHSVSPIVADASRCCVSNYYFSPIAPDGHEHFHVTSFRGRPDQLLRDLVLRADIGLRTGIRRLFPGGLRATTHFYDRDADGHDKPPS